MCAMLMLATQSRADDKKPDPKAPPHVMMSMPLAVVRGSTTTLILRGKALAEASEVQADAGDKSLHVKIKSKGKAELPKPELAEKLGDTQVEIELEVPADVSGDEIKLQVTAPTGKSDSHIVRVYNAADLTGEKEPNGGFRTAQPIVAPTTVIGSIEKENDVDVFRIDGKAGQKLTAEVFAARLGSAMDSLVTIYDDHGQILAVNDDADTTDSLLKFTLPHDGVFYIGLTDAMGNGGAMYPYLMHVAVE